jgi:D-arginine dehydrogenase
LDEKADFLIVGAGIAGASIGYFLAPHGRVVVLERESQPGYHTTGRSAALFIESYGTPQVRALTCASRAFFETPPSGFAEHPLLSPRGAMLIGTSDQSAALDEAFETARGISQNVQRLDEAATHALVPVLAPGMRAVLEQDPMDMDVNAIHQGYLRGLKARGGKVICNAEVTRCERIGAEWEAEAGGKTWRAPVVVNAAGAWCDKLAELAGAFKIGLQPKRRSAFIFAPPAGVETARWPMVFGTGESFYFKPDAGLLLGSPANEDPVDPQDIQPEEYDIALGIGRIEEATTMHIRRPTRVWAGLRSFVADGDLVGGYDSECKGFFWLAAQGGYGIQTSPAMGEACAAIVREVEIPSRIAAFGLDAKMLSAERRALERHRPRGVPLSRDSG